MEKESVEGYGKVLVGMEKLQESIWGYEESRGKARGRRAKRKGLHHHTHIGRHPSSKLSVVRQARSLCSFVASSGALQTELSELRGGSLAVLWTEEGALFEGFVRRLSRGG